MTMYKVIASPEGQFSVISFEQIDPPNWINTGHCGSVAECIGYISTLMSAKPNQNQDIKSDTETATTTPIIQADQGLMANRVPLVPMQIRFFERNLSVPHHYNIARLFEVTKEVNSRMLEEAIRYVIAHHDALRLRFVRKEAHWEQYIVSSDEASPFIEINLSSVPEAEQARAIAQRAAELQLSLNLSEGPLLRVALFHLGVARSSRLLIIVHHLVADGLSMVILLEDLLTAYTQLCDDGNVIIPATTSFKKWAERLAEYAHSAHVRSEAAYWMTRPWNRDPVLPLDYPENRHVYHGTSCTIKVSLSVDETRDLQQIAPRIYKSRVINILLSSIALAVSRWAISRWLSIEYISHGRSTIFEDMSIFRTIGWFNSYFPLLLDLDQTSNPVNALDMVNGQLKSAPHGGVGYTTLRYMSKDEVVSAEMKSIPSSDVYFNFLGNLDRKTFDDASFRAAHEDMGPTRDPGSYIPFSNGLSLLYCEGGVSQEQLILVWRYRENQYRSSTIERLVQGFLESLRAFISEAKRELGNPETS
jgi:non-ribosomal peptide synthase protein (TIGR01720 family)